MTCEHHSTIALRAYDLWEQEGRPNGKDLEHWLRAEAELAPAVAAALAPEPAAELAPEPAPPRQTRTKASPAPRPAAKRPRRSPETASAG